MARLPKEETLNGGKREFVREKTLERERALVRAIHRIIVLSRK